MSPRIRIGYTDKTCRRKLYYPHDSHLLLCAPAGSGKGVSIIVPALMEYQGSGVCIDPKGENAAICAAELMRQGVNVLKINPYNILPEALGHIPSIGYNPLVSLDPKSHGFGSDCDSLAEAICYRETGENASYFIDSARQAISRVIMEVAKSAPPGKRNLVTVYELFSGPQFYEFCRMACNTGDLLVRGRLGRFIGPKAEENKELSGIVNTARTALGFMGNKAMMQSLKGSNPPFRFSDLRQKRTMVFLILPTKYLQTSSKWFRLVIASAMSSFLAEERGPFSILAVLDEFAQLGALRVMSDIMGIGRGYGLKLFPILQDLNQLRELYPERWETFLANSGAQIFFAPRDITTAEYISKRCGITQVQRPSKSVSQTLFGTEDEIYRLGGGTSINLETRPLYHPHEVANLPGNEMFVFGENIPGVIRAGRKPYWLMPECKSKASPNPYHRKG